ncbi:MAG: ATP-dependent RNA helicase HrpA [Jiangellales bacterium]
MPPVPPALAIPAELPIAARADDIAAAMRANQVVVVAGETGSGKTTQLPKIALSLLGERGRIAHTQPRRLAARTVADRIADEMGTEPGDVVGSRVRFSDRTSRQTRITLMTDGILLAEISRDRLLRRYDTIIIDEAHERSLTIDFLLGYLAEILPRRGDLRVVITSATIDPQRFADHFTPVVGVPVPVIEVSGRTYPVQVRYRPFGPGHDPAEVERDQVQAIIDAVDELASEAMGDVLVFLSGEREIRDTADALREHLSSSTDVLPLYARLSNAEQLRVFAPHGGRRVVLATNVAETSLTVPGIRYVVDAGTARISRYSMRTKVQRLPIEPVSQASADQRKGRCGRVADGICIRLYTEQDYTDRPRFTDPEILRTNLAAVILQMAALGLGDLEAFPFVDPPDRRNLRDGIGLLDELGALEHATQATSLTPVGRRLSRLPVDPRLGRMVLEADRLGCVQEVLVIAAALSIQDPRERPVDARDAAALSHRRFADPTSDLIGYLNLWAYLQDKQRELSGSKFRRMCRDEYLHFLRIREWQDLVTQLRRACRELGIEVPARPNLSPEAGQRADPDRVHQAVLAGLLSHLGMWDEEKRDFTGARNARFAINPGSALAKKPPRWVMAGELVETTRVWARDVARIDPAWVEAVAPAHLLVRSYSEPRWDARRGSVMATEKVTLYGIPVVAARTVGYARVDPVLARELFIRHALVEGDWRTRHHFFHENRARLAEIADLEDRTRRRDVALDDDGLFALYDERLPTSVVSARHFDSWWKKRRQRDPDLLTFSTEQLTRPDTAGSDAGDFPDSWTVDDLTFAVDYRFEPGTDADGLTVTVPLTVLNRLDADAFTWQVPGFRAELVQAMLRAMPKALRRSFVPAPDYAAAVTERLSEPAGRLAVAVAEQLTRFGGPVVAESDIDLGKVPPFLLVRVAVVDDSNRVVGSSRDLSALQRTLAPRTAKAVADAAPSIERVGLTGWTVGTIPHTVEAAGVQGGVRGFPALVDEGATAALRVLASADEQRRAMPRGVRRLLLLDLPSPSRAVVRRLDGRTKLALSHNPYSSVPALLDDAAAAAVDDLMARSGGVPWDEAAYQRLRSAVRAHLDDTTHQVVQQIGSALAIAHEVTLRTSALDPTSAVRDDLEAQMAGLVFDGFVSQVGVSRLPDLVRYLRGMQRRLDVLPGDPVRDARRMAEVHVVEDAYLDRVDALPAGRRGDAAVVDVRWMLEELRINAFAQQLGTPRPVSAKRIRTALAAL